MKYFILKLIKAASLISVGLVIGVVFGLREGAFAFMYIDGVPRGLIATSQLRALDKGDLKPSRHFLETDVDQALYYHSLIKDQWWYFLYRANLLFGASPGDLDGYVKRVAEYRIKHPGPPQNPAIFDVVPKEKEEYKTFYQELAISHRDRINRIEATIKANAGK